ncbi:MAG: heavy-metal-associated domain-containing protein [Bacillota bacterium]|nr:heavy-metal-associated domain-containing protein [Bacillota bacterium]
METTLLKIEGMSCNHCKMTVEKALQSTPGVQSTQVDLARREAKITGTADRKSLEKAVQEAGYIVVNK